ncbi:TerD-family protein [Streptomyces sp. AJS327]|uniref:TerD family protein n=1 Tax=Streptomyces sp. AJS327 TaxID=2545265 RepID=UPI0015DFE0B5|nr:TerD family protein [Streptomyces sp. AJS327]MBA0050622.1 TerD-family protein [Streptomyces sp. AJS327]
MSGLSKGIGKAEVTLKWDPSPFGAPPTDLDLVAAVYPADDPRGRPGYLVYFDSRAPDGTITLTRDSRTGQGLGTDEAMTLELERLAESYGRVVCGVAIQQREGHKTFGEVTNTLARVVEDTTELLRVDFSGAPDSTAAIICEFVRDDEGEWRFRPTFQGMDTDPAGFAELLGGDPH